MSGENTAGRLMQWGASCNRENNGGLSRVTKAIEKGHRCRQCGTIADEMEGY